MGVWKTIWRVSLHSFALGGPLKLRYCGIFKEKLLYLFIINWVGDLPVLHGSCAAYFHGQTFKVDSHRKDIATVLPATFVTATMTAFNPGIWMLNCVVDDHYNAGMYALFNVSRCNGVTPMPPISGGKVRKYYIAADEVLWDYGPSGMDNMTGKSLTKAGRFVTTLIILLLIEIINYCSRQLGWWGLKTEEGIGLVYSGVLLSPTLIRELKHEGAV